jgi:hypothetical protein
LDFLKLPLLVGIFLPVYHEIEPCKAMYSLRSLSGFGDILLPLGDLAVDVL